MQTVEAPIGESALVLEQQPEVLRKLEAQWEQGKFLCVGLDVVADEDGDDLFGKAMAIVEATKDVAAAFKPNSAFYERYGSKGQDILQALVEQIQEIAPDVPVIWDAKRADIANTNNGYMAAFEDLGADAVTVHPYLGGSAVKPLMSDTERLAFVLGHTSNPGAAEFQHLELKQGDLLWERVVRNVAHSDEWDHGAVRGLVLGATYPDELAKARWIAGNDVVMLVPGVGTQGGDLEASVVGSMNSTGNGFLINVSSGISKAADSRGEVTHESMSAAAHKFHDQINNAWQNEKANPSPSYGETMITEFDERLATALFEEECILFGNFTLKSGLKSPVYVDLRRAITDPEIRSNLAAIYQDMVRGMEARRGEPYDVLAAFPQASTSMGAIVAHQMGRRLIQPRSGTKSYGSKETILGKYSEGESVGFIDDLVTRATSAFEVIDQAESAGLVYGGLVTLIDREQGGFREMAARGRAVNSATTLRGLVRALGSTGQISKYREAKVLKYLES